MAAPAANLCLGKNPRPQCTVIVIAGVGNDLCELLCKKLDIQHCCSMSLSAELVKQLPKPFFFCLPQHSTNRCPILGGVVGVG